MYVAATGKLLAPDASKSIRVYPVANGRHGGRRFGISPACRLGSPTVLAPDEYGNLWSSAGDGVHCLSPEGRLLGRVKVPATVSNVTFGGRLRDRLFICASTALYAIHLNVRGATWP